MEDLFEKLKDYHVTFRSYGIDEHITVEELYQAFKKRMLEEIAVEEPLPREAYIPMMKSLKIPNDLRAGKGKQIAQDKEEMPTMYEIYCYECGALVEVRLESVSKKLCKECRALMKAKNRSEQCEAAKTRRLRKMNKPAC